MEEHCVMASGGGGYRQQAYLNSHRLYIRADRAEYLFGSTPFVAVGVPVFGALMARISVPLQRRSEWSRDRYSALFIRVLRV